jgi:hypothetical protein
VYPVGWGTLLSTETRKERINRRICDALHLTCRGHITAFQTHHGLWAHLDMPQGARSAANAWAAAVDRVFVEVPDEQISYYQDDVVAHGNGHAAHVEAAWFIFHILRDARIRLKLVKLLIGTRPLICGRALRSAPTYTANQWRESSGDTQMGNAAHAY